jgi:2,5-diketo-D-gluconate reductase A
MVECANLTRIKPMVNQMETHIFNQEKEMQKWCDKYGIRLEAWAPFGEGRKDTFTNPVIQKIGGKYGKTTAQVMLRWLIQRGIIVIPKSTHYDRMAENFSVFDFALSDEDMQEIAALDTAESSFFSHQDPNTVEWFMNLIQKRREIK